MRFVWLVLAWPFVAAWNIWDWWRYDLGLDDKVLMGVALVIVLALVW